MPDPLLSSASSSYSKAMWSRECGHALDDFVVSNGLNEGSLAIYCQECVPRNEPSRRVRFELVYLRVHRSRWQNVPSNPITPYPTDGPFLGHSPGSKLPSTIIPSLRDKDLCRHCPQRLLHRVKAYWVIGRLPDFPAGRNRASEQLKQDNDQDQCQTENQRPPTART
jgi:hypothetical protein